MTHRRYSNFIDIGPCTNETPCGDCIDAMYDRLSCLARNLVIGAGLCASFREGFDNGWGMSGEGHNAEYSRLSNDGYERMATSGGDEFDWRPGCGRSAR